MTGAGHSQQFAPTLISVRTPPQRPEGALLEAARQAAHLSQNKAAELAGMSGTRWRDIVKGYAPAGGMKVPVKAPAETVARMALVVRVTAQQLREVARADAADLVEELATAGDSIDRLMDAAGIPAERRDVARRMLRALVEEDPSTSRGSRQTG